MQPVVLDEPYEFVPPYFGRIWPWLLMRFVRRRLRNSEGIEQVSCIGLERLKESLDAGHAVCLAPNHCRSADPLVVAEMCRQAGVTPFTMASWHLFKQSALRTFALRRIGAFSVYREGLDRQALQAAIDILQQAKRPLVIFPEGVVTRTNDRIVSLMEGLSFIARSAAKKLSVAHPPGQVVVYPVAIRYHFHGDIDATLHETLDSIERRLSWRPKRDADRVQRIYRVGEALLWLKEIEYFGRPQSGSIPERLSRLIDQILVPMEQEWLAGKSASNAVARVKQLRFAILPGMIAGDISETERSRRWAQLEDMYLAQQLSHYPPDYVRSNPSPERLLETVEKFEEDLTDACRVHRPMTAQLMIGTAIPVSPKRSRGNTADPVMTEIERQLHELLEIPRKDANSGPESAHEETTANQDRAESASEG